MSEAKQIAVVGGGISGLAAAYYLQKEIKHQELPYEVKLVEASDQLGGKIRTEQRDGFTIERGPDSFLARKKSASELAADVGLGDQLVPNGTGQSYILVKNKLHKMPSGSFMGIPTKVRPFLFSSLFSPVGKVKAAKDFVKSKGEPQDDQSLGHFFRGRLGDEVVENLIEPLLSGIYAGDIDNLSLMSTFPNFYHLEQEYGSLIKGLNEKMPNRKPAKKGQKPSMFLTLRDGLESLVNAVAGQLEDDTVCTNTAVDHIENKGSYYHLLLSDGTVMKADSIILAAPHLATERMLSKYDFMKPFQEMPATSVANVALAFDESAIKKDIDGTGFVVSRNSDFRITACTWTHKKWPHSTPKGKVLLRCYVGKPDDQAVVDLSDQEIIDIVLKDLNKTMNITAEPEFSVITRWKNAMPQYTVGHKQRMEEIHQAMAQELPGVYLAGGSYHGVGVPDCIDQGKDAVGKVLNFLQNK
ncbi:oxygen-dependent protoporphyrinogen oxidase [Thalassobacillus cyri]|uniref:Coproporphyrinogen III oxidase n=1 Tax=Thalassobacillus cyri TaxID=571932 RepID=A0A1H4GJA7_9BACI|nr:protoporphyrinogen oxidase [Thalassobacillus cyri]SEB09709.1 oxygen-dependent protoporphyrinogen oxidase [Thalassobacillus cyri]